MFVHVLNLVIPAVVVPCTYPATRIYSLFGIERNFMRRFERIKIDGLFVLDTHGVFLENKTRFIGHSSSLEWHLEKPRSGFSVSGSYKRIIDARIINTDNIFALFIFRNKKI